MFLAGKLFLDLVASYHLFLLSVVTRALLIGIIIAGWISA